MKRILWVLVLLFAFSGVGHSQNIGGLSVESYKVYAFPRGFKSLRVYLSAIVNSKVDTMQVSGLKLTVYRRGQPFANGTCNDFAIPTGRYSYTYKGRIDLAEGISAWQAWKYLLSFETSDYTVSYTVNVIRSGGKVVVLSRSGIPLSKYLKPLKR